MADLHGAYMANLHAAYKVVPKSKLTIKIGTCGCEF